MMNPSSPRGILEISHTDHPSRAGHEGRDNHSSHPGGQSCLGCLGLGGSKVVKEVQDKGARVRLNGIFRELIKGLGATSLTSWVKGFHD